MTVVLAAVGCAADLLTKTVLFRQLGMPGTQPPDWIVSDFLGLRFGFETSINTGGLFGMFSGNTLPLAIISIFALLGIGWWLTFGGAIRDWFLTVVLGLIIGGILGNLYDRLGLWGIHGVRDWILFRYKQHTWPNFNIADILLVCGAGLMLLHSFRMEQSAKRDEAAKANTQTTDSAATT